LTSVEDSSVVMLDQAGRLLERPAQERLVNSSLERLEAISILLAELASKAQAVVAFRISALNNKLLAPEEVGEWINKQAQAEGEPTTWVELPLPLDAKQSIDFQQGDLTVNFPSSVRIRNEQVKVLEYGVPEDRHKRAVPTTIGGILDKLRELSESLA